MSHPVSFSVTKRTRRRILLLALGTLTLLALIVTGRVAGWNAPLARLPATNTLQDADHASTGSPIDSHAHEAAQSTVDHPEASAQTDHHEGDAQTAPTEHAHDNPDLSLHAGETALAHVDEPEGHGEAGGHGTAIATVSPLTKQIVLGGFAGVNALVILIAGIGRRRNPPKLPKHFQSKKEQSYGSPIDTTTA